MGNSRIGAFQPFPVAGMPSTWLRVLPNDPSEGLPRRRAWNEVILVWCSVRRRRKPLSCQNRVCGAREGGFLELADNGRRQAGGWLPASWSDDSETGSWLRPRRSRDCFSGPAGQAPAASVCEQCHRNALTQAGPARGPVTCGGARLILAGTPGERATENRHRRTWQLPVKAFRAEYHPCLTLLQSSRGDDRVAMVSSCDKGGAHDRRVLEHLVGPDRHVVIEVGAVAGELHYENPGLRLVGDSAQTVLGLAPFGP